MESYWLFVAVISGLFIFGCVAPTDQTKNETIINLSSNNYPNSSAFPSFCENIGNKGDLGYVETGLSDIVSEFDTIDHFAMWLEEQPCVSDVWIDSSILKRLPEIYQIHTEFQFMDGTQNVLVLVSWTDIKYTTLEIFGVRAE